MYLDVRRTAGERSSGAHGAAAPRGGDTVSALVAIVALPVQFADLRPWSQRKSGPELTPTN